MTFDTHWQGNICSVVGLKKESESETVREKKTDTLIQTETNPMFNQCKEQSINEQSRMQCAEFIEVIESRRKKNTLLLEREIFCKDKSTAKLLFSMSKFERWCFVHRHTHKKKAFIFSNQISLYRRQLYADWLFTKLTFSDTLNETILYPKSLPSKLL